MRSCFAHTDLTALLRAMVQYTGITEQDAAQIYDIETGASQGDVITNVIYEPEPKPKRKRSKRGRKKPSG